MYVKLQELLVAINSAKHAFALQPGLDGSTELIPDPEVSFYEPPTTPAPVNNPNSPSEEPAGEVEMRELDIADMISREDSMAFGPDP